MSKTERQAFHHRITAQLVNNCRNHHQYQHLGDAEAASTFLTPEQLECLYQTSLTLARRDDLVELAGAFSSMVALMTTLENLLENKGLDLESGLMAGARHSINSLVVDLYSRFGYDIHMGISNMSEVPTDTSEGNN